MSEQEKIKDEQRAPEDIADLNKTKKETQDTRESGHSAEHKTSKTHKKNVPVEALETLQSKLNEISDKYLRLYSEFDNYRKRTLREKAELTKTATSEIIIDLLPVMDDFERAISNSETTDHIDAIREGEKLIFAKLKRILEQKGLEETKTIGESFNTDLHDAISSVAAASEEMKGKIIDEIQKGYLLNGKVIRYAKVVVGQ
ncbi:MAG: nucleotide exchange factor GrpE [Bacteroidales bacterium]|nr:nucleotide exchange factor GrpE [Lentimicrobiaceae bacterium]MDD5694636.1 nucleotide exchange factor GrpE [Bacteroidales bacterium]